MWKILFRIYGFEILNYWVMIFFGAGLTITLVSRNALALRKNLPPEKLGRLPTPGQMAMVTSLAFLSGLIGARITYVLYNIQNYSSIGQALNIFRGGMISFGGYLGAMLTIMIYAKITRAGTLKISDLIFAYLPVFDIFQRLGCLLNGCCFGKTTGSCLGMILPSEPYAAPRHPVPLYFIGLAIIVFAALRVLRGKPHKPGTITVWFFMLYFPFRFFIEFFQRGIQPAPGIFINVTQLVCLALFILCVFCWNMLRKKYGKDDSD